jgi:hypothetical protein
VILVDTAKTLDGVVDAKVLMVHGEDLDEAAEGAAEEGEVLDDVQQSVLVAGPAHDGLQGNDPLFSLVVDPLPLVEVFPGGRRAADAALTAVGEDDERVVPEEPRDGGFVVPEVLRVRLFETLVRGLELEQDEGQSVDKPDEVGPSWVNVPRHPELGGE